MEKSLLFSEAHNKAHKENFECLWSIFMVRLGSDETVARGASGYRGEEDDDNGKGADSPGRCVFAI